MEREAPESIQIGFVVGLNEIGLAHGGPLT